MKKRFAVTAVLLISLLAVGSVAWAMVQTYQEEEPVVKEKKVRVRVAEGDAETMDLQDDGGKRVVIIKRAGDEEWKDSDEKVIKIKKHLKSAGDKPRLGMALMLKKIGEDDVEGPTIANVFPGSSAEEEGLSKGDIVLTFDGKAVLTGDDDLLDIPDFEEGQQVVVEYLRDGAKKKATITARTFPHDEYVWFGGDGEGEFDFDFDIQLDDLHEHGMAKFISLGHPFHGHGLALQPMNPDLGEYFGVSEGVLVVRTPEEFPLDLKGGDVITKIGGEKVMKPVEAKIALHGGAPGESIAVDLIRHGKPMVISGVMPDEDVLFLGGEKKINVEVIEDEEGADGERTIRVVVGDGDGEEMIWTEKEDE